MPTTKSLAHHDESHVSRRLTLSLSFIPFLGGCSAARTLNALVPRDTYQLNAGAAYGDDPRQALDVYTPTVARGHSPVVVFFYGGNWTRGCRQDYRFVGEALASAGVVTVIADYRLSPAVRWRDILADCSAAAFWTRTHAERIGADPGRLFLVGHSAGAYNAAMLALDERWLAASGMSPCELAGWVGIAGPYDFLPIRDPETRVAFDWPDTPRDSQPIAHATQHSPRTLLLAANRDKLVDPLRNSTHLAQRLNAVGAPVRLRTFDHLNHATALGVLAPPLRWLAPVRDELLEFIGMAGTNRTAPSA